MLSYVFQFLTPSSYSAEAPESLLSKQILEELQQISGIELNKCEKSLHNLKGYLNCFFFHAQEVFQFTSKIKLSLLAEALTMAENKPKTCFKSTKAHIPVEWNCLLAVRENSVLTNIYTTGDKK